jgi:hypothetical protein
VRIRASVPTLGERRLTERRASNGRVQKEKRRGRMLKSKARGLLRRRSRPLWIISCNQNNRMEVLTIAPDGSGGGGGCYVPVFSFKEEAQTFLYLLEDDERRKWSGLPGRPLQEN